MKLFLYLFFLFSAYIIPAINGKISFQKSIVNGVYAKPGDVPFIVRTWQAGGKSLCGASVIGPKTLLTAAHCLDKTLGAVRMRYGTLSQHVSPYPTLYSNDYVIHPNYPDVVYDIAVIRLENDDKIVEDSVVKYAKLQRDALKVGDPVTIYGWGDTKGTGKSDFLRKTFLNVTKPIGETRIFLKGNNTTSCQGDSGGPAVSADGKLSGVLSSGTTGCPGWGYAIYTNVSAFVDWIDQQ